MTGGAPGRLVVERSPEAVAAQAAAWIANRLRETLGSRSTASLALSGGNTPREAYTRLAQQPGVAWARVNVFWVDERAVPPTDDRSNYRWAKETLLSAANVPSDRAHRMPADRPPLADAAAQYEEELRRLVASDAGGPAFDAMVLGVGEDGHTASLFPGDPTVHIRDRLVAAVGARPSREARLTLTAPVIQNARLVVVLAVGSAKRPALERIWDQQGDLDQTPGRLLRACNGELVFVVDAEAAGTPRG